MSLDPTQSEQDALAATLRRHATRMTAREMRGILVGVVVFAAAEAALLLARTPHIHDGLHVAICVGVLALAARVRIDLPFGFTVPTQLAFVPLVFAAPRALVPAFVLAALLVADLLDVARGKLRLGRLLHAPGNAAFAFGPAALFALSGVRAKDAGPALLIAALGAQFAVDFGVSALRQAVERGASLAAQLRDTWVYGVDAGLACVGLVVAREAEHSAASVLALIPLLVLLAIFARERRARLESMLELGDAYRGTALVLGDVVEADDGYTGAHCKSVVALAMAVGAELRLDSEARRNLEFGALLHDVGKIAIPKEILNKPGALDREEWAIMQTHAVEGQRMLDRVGGFMREVGFIVRSHHERWDGGGYPDGLVGQDIPLAARIIACCDAWNAMRTNRPYRTALAYERARKQLVEGAGTQFDPAAAEALIRVLARDELAALDPPDELDSDDAEPTAGEVVSAA